MDARTRDLHMITTLRSVRHEAIEQSRAGNLTAVFASSDDAVQQIYVVKLLDVHPKLGKVAGRRLLQSLNVGQFDRVEDLSATTRTAILREIGEQ